MEIAKQSRRAVARAVAIAFLAALTTACADQNSGPAPVYYKTAMSPPPVAAPRPAGARAIAPPAAVERVVTVESGESVDRIAHRYHVPASAIVAANGLKPPYKLQPGMRLKLPGAAPLPSPVQTAAAPPTPLPPPHPETLAPPAQPQNPAQPSRTAAAPPPATTAAAAVIPLDTPPPRQVAAAQGPPPVVGVPAPAVAAPTAAAPAAGAPASTSSGAPPVLPPRNAAAALPLPGEAPIDWGSADAAQAAAGRFPWPVHGRVLASYGSTVGGSRNDGINIAAPLGTPVRAIDAGVVAYAGNEVKGYGNLVLIRHANGWISAYAHLDALSVKVGDKIAAGQAFARVGETGGVGEPQLHFELRRGKKPVDPKEFLAPAPSAAVPAGGKAG